MAAVADEIDQEIPLKAFAVRAGEPRRLDAGLGIVGIHMDDRNLESARQAARVRRAVFIFGPGRETELVVHDDVDGATRPVTGQPAQVQRLGDDALAGKCRVTVNENRQRDRAVKMSGAPLIGVGARRARHSHGNWIDGFKVARVGRHRDVHLPSWRRCSCARVVLHVAHPSEVGPERSGRDRILELREDLRVRLVENVREHVEPAAMRHPEHGVTRAMAGGAADHFVEHRHEHVEPLEREARLAGERPMQKPLEHLDLRDAIEDRFHVVRVHRRQESSRFGRMPQPFALFRDEHMRIIEAGRGAIDPAQLLDGLERIRG